MKASTMSRRKMVGMLVLPALSALWVNRARAQAPIKLQHWAGTINFSSAGPSAFTLAGTASHLGQFTAYGEVVFRPGPTAGSLVGEGVVVFTTANGDLLVGVVTWEAGAEAGGLRTSHIHFSWRDAVRFRDGRTVANTGRFVDGRPPGLVVIAIIAILIGLLLPA